MRHLRYFVAVAEHLHFGRAAVHLRVAQPSVSHQIRQLEVELKTTLLERTKRRVRLTESGRLFLEQAREILVLADRAAVTARAASAGEGQPLRVGFARWMDVTRLVRTVKRMDERHPSVRLQIRVMSVPLQLVALRDDELDVGFVRPPVADPTLRSQSLVSEPFILALPTRHQLSGRKQIRVSTLAAEPFILFPRTSVPQYYDLMLRMCQDAGFVPHVRQEADHPDLALRLVAAGLGLSLVPASARKLARRGVVFRPLESSPMVLETAVAWRQEPSPVLKTFLDVVSEVFGAAKRQIGRAQ